MPMQHDMEAQLDPVLNAYHHAFNGDFRQAVAVAIHIDNVKWRIGVLLSIMTLQKKRCISTADSCVAVAAVLLDATNQAMLIPDPRRRLKDFAWIVKGYVDIGDVWNARALAEQLPSTRDTRTLLFTIARRLVGQDVNQAIKVLGRVEERAQLLRGLARSRELHEKDPWLRWWGLSRIATALLEAGDRQGAIGVAETAATAADRIEESDRRRFAVHLATRRRRTICALRGVEFRE